MRISGLSSLLLSFAVATLCSAENRPARYIIYPKKGAFDSQNITAFFEEEPNITPVYSLGSVKAKVIDVHDTTILDKIASHPQIAYLEKDVVRSLMQPFSDASEHAIRRTLRGLAGNTTQLQDFPTEPNTTTYGLQLIGADVTPLRPGTTAEEVMVCIIDSGVNAKHPGLAGAHLDGYGDYATDLCGHGTHVTGTVAGGKQFAVAPGISVYSVKMYDGEACRASFSSDLVAALEHCTRAAGKAKLVINLSLGGPDSSPLEQTAFTNLYRSGVLSIAAAGNARRSEDRTTLIYPAAYEDVVSVAAVDDQKAVAYFSHANEFVDIAAPGVSIYSTYKNDYDWQSGTSMAAPHVTGAAAVVWSYGVKKGWTNEQVRTALLSTALDLGQPGRDNDYGAGLVNVCKAAKLAGFDEEGKVTCP